jgi:hypothetical protein
MINKYKINKTKRGKLKMENQCTLIKGEEKRLVRTAEEARESLNSGFGPQTLDDALGLRKFGVDIHAISRKEEIERLKNKFSANANRELIYLTGGLDNWFESVNNYWHNRHNEKYNLSKCSPRPYRDMEIGFTGLEKQLFEKISRGHGQIFHQDTKDVRATADYLDKFNKENLREEDNLDTKEFRENIVYEIGYKSGERAFWQEENIPARLTPKNTAPKGYNPLLEPFRETIEKLKTEGVTELPDWLAEQGIMAGMSSVYQDIPLRLNQWMEKAAKSEAAQSYLPKTYAENLLIIDKQVHRR